MGYKILENILDLYSILILKFQNLVYSPLDWKF